MATKNNTTKPQRLLTPAMILNGKGTKAELLKFILHYGGIGNEAPSLRWTRSDLALLADRVAKAVPASWVPKKAAKAKAPKKAAKEEEDRTEIPGYDFVHRPVVVQRFTGKGKKARSRLAVELGGKPAPQWTVAVRNDPIDLLADLDGVIQLDGSQDAPGEPHHCPRCGKSASDSEELVSLFGLRKMTSSSAKSKSVVIVYRPQSYCRACRSAHARNVRLAKKANVEKASKPAKKAPKKASKPAKKAKASKRAKKAPEGRAVEVERVLSERLGL